MKERSDERGSNSDKIKAKSDKSSDWKPDKESSDQVRSSSNLTSISDKNGMLCPKSVRNQLKKNKDSSDKSDLKSDFQDGKKSKNQEDSVSKYLVKKPISHISEDKTIEVVKINKEIINLSADVVKSTKCKPIILYSGNPGDTDLNSVIDDSNQTVKHKKKKKHNKAKISNEIEDSNMDGTVKLSKKSRKTKKKKHKDVSSEELILKKEKVIEKVDKEVLSTDDKISKGQMSLLVSYSSDEEETNIEIKPPVIKTSPELKPEPLTIGETIENKIEIKIKPTKSPGKSAWDSTDSELENEPKPKDIAKVKSRSRSVVSKHSKRTKSSTSKEKSESKSYSKSNSGSRSKSGSHSHSRSHSRSSKSRSRSSDSRSRSYSRSHSRSYSESSDSRSRSYSRSRSRSRRKSRHHRRHSSSYSRSYSRYRSRSLSRSSSDSRSSRSYSRSRSRYKSSHSNRYRSRSRSRSSRSHSRTSYYRSSYRRRKRSSSPDDFLNTQTRKGKQTLGRNSLLHGVAPKPVDIGKKIDAIKESQKKVAEAHNNQNMSNLNIPLPPEKPKNNPVKPGPGEWCPSMDFGGPVAKKAKKITGANKGNTDGKGGDTSVDGVPLSDNQLADYNYIGPQVSSDMAKKLGLDVKTNKKENTSKKTGIEQQQHLQQQQYLQQQHQQQQQQHQQQQQQQQQQSLSESYLTQTLDPNHLALQSRAYQHRLNNLQGNSNSEFGGQTAQYFHPLYMSPSSLTNNLTATALAAVASEQLPASVAGSLAQAAVQRIMSSSNLTATYNTPAVVATPTASYQTALHQTIPGSCSTLVANTPSGLVPISLLQQGGLPYGINQLVLQHLQQQALGAQLGQAIALPNQSLLGSINPLLLQASNQQALLQSLGFGAQTQLLASPLNIQHTLLMAAQQQQHQMLAAAQLNQAATIQAAQLQAQIQAQARAVSLQNMQQAAQMQSSAQSAAAAAAMAATVAMDHASEQMTNKSDPMISSSVPSVSSYSSSASLSSSSLLLSASSIPTTSVSSATVSLATGSDETKLNLSDYQISSDQFASIFSESNNNLISSSTTELNNHFDESAVNTTVTTEPMGESLSFNNTNSNSAGGGNSNVNPDSAELFDHHMNVANSNDILIGSSSASNLGSGGNGGAVKQQAPPPRIIYNSPAVMASLAISSPGGGATKQL